MHAGEAIEAVEALFERREDDGIDALLHDDIVLKPPTYWKTWRGKAAVARLLRFAAFNIDKLHYVRRFESGDHVALQFEAEIAGMEFSGVDLLTLAHDGRIAEFEIVARPPKAILELSRRMGASLGADPFFAKGA